MKTMKMKMMSLLCLMAMGLIAAHGSQTERPKMNGSLRVTTLSAEDVRYTGKPYIKELGAYVFIARSYSPELGRWTTADPSGFPNGANNYFYAAIPTKSFDPLGLYSLDNPPTQPGAFVDDKTGRTYMLVSRAYTNITDYIPKPANISPTWEQFLNGVGTAAGAAPGTAGQLLSGMQAGMSLVSQITADIPLANQSSVNDYLANNPFYTIVNQAEQHGEWSPWDPAGRTIAKSTWFSDPTTKEQDITPADGLPAPGAYTLEYTTTRYMMEIVE